MCKCSKNIKQKKIYQTKKSNFLLCDMEGERLDSNLDLTLKLI